MRHKTCCKVEPRQQTMYHHLLNKIKIDNPEWKAHVIKNTLLMVALILEEKTVNLWKLKSGVGKQLGTNTVDSRSHYQRIKRWFWASQSQKGMWVVILKAALSLLTKQADILIIDGSSWKSGGVCYHFLTLSLLYNGVSIPIWWIDLDRLGQSHQWHRKLLLKTALKVLDLRHKVLLGDREYIGTEWFKVLKSSLIDIVIRLRVTDYQCIINQKGKPISKLESKAKSKLGKAVWKFFVLNDQTYTFVIVAYKNRSGKIELLRLITTLTPAKAMAAYNKRYRIESMFKNLKSNGFDLEALNLKYTYKVQLMMSVVVLAYTLAVIYGLKDFKKKINIKKHGSPEMSVFRWGLDKWQNHLNSMINFLDKLYLFWKVTNSNQNKIMITHVP